MFMIALTVSVCPKVSSWMGGFFNILQYPYRLTTYVNLSIFVILIVLAGRMGPASVRHKQIINVCLAFCIALSFFSLALKLIHASAIEQKSTDVSENSWSPLPFGSSKHLNDILERFNEAKEYSIIDGFKKDTLSGSGIVPLAPLNFNVLEGAQFGQVEALTLNLTEPTLMITNIQPFPWNHIAVNGTLVPQDSIFISGGTEAVLLPQGEYRLEFVPQIDGIWKSLNFLSWIVLLGWMVVYVAFTFKLIFLKKEGP
jgi:hypothetical protein